MSIVFRSNSIFCSHIHKSQQQGCNNICVRHKKSFHVHLISLNYYILLSQKRDMFNGIIRFVTTVYICFYNVSMIVFRPPLFMLSYKRGSCNQNYRDSIFFVFLQVSLLHHTNIVDVVGKRMMMSDYHMRQR